MPTKIELCNAADVDVGAVLKVEKDDLTLARTGAVVGPPCMVPIKTYPTVVEGGKVFIEV